MRAKERVGIKNGKSAQRLMKLAFERGQRSTDVSRSGLRNYLAARCRQGVEAVAYNEYCFLFDSDTGACITLYPLPRKLNRHTCGREMTRGYDNPQIWAW